MGGHRAWTPDTTPPLKERLPDVPEPPTRGTTERGRSRGRDGGGPDLVVEEGLETEAATGARVGQVEQEARAGQAEQEATRVEQALEWTAWAPGTEQALERTACVPGTERALERTAWAPGTERALERTWSAPGTERALERTAWAPGTERTAWAPGTDSVSILKAEPLKLRARLM